jgi:hypothetical protein
MIAYPNNKEHQNPVQVDTDKIFLYRSLSNGGKTASNVKRRNSRENERKLREKTAHIGRKASLASQGTSWNPFA